MDANLKHLNGKYYIDESNVYSKCKHAYDNYEGIVKMCM